MSDPTPWQHLVVADGEICDYLRRHGLLRYEQATELFHAIARIRAVLEDFEVSVAIAEKEEGGITAH